ncbi:VPA1267 family protein [Aeromonas veronii]|uniref:VPA1267 family protein n=2 Tax=Aeromonas veronii TaxID=654 RepID=UPI003158C39D
MASGQQKAQQNLEAFEVWKATQTDDDFKQIVFRGQLNRIEVAKGIGCGKSALNQNPAIKKALKALEYELRGKGVLPPLTDTAKKNEGKPQAYDNTANRKLLDSGSSDDMKRITEAPSHSHKRNSYLKELLS